MFRTHIRPDQLRQRCNTLGWSVDDLAHATGVSRATIYRYLSHSAQPGPEFIAACAAHFGERALPELFEFGYAGDPPPQIGRQRFAPRLSA